MVCSPHQFFDDFIDLVIGFEILDVEVYTCQSAYIHSLRIADIIIGPYLSTDILSIE